MILYTHTHTGTLLNKIKIILIVFIILITLVICFNIGAYAAYILSATEVVYTKTDGTEISVKSALDDLYVKVPTKEIGDEVTVGGEQFYVLEWDNNCDTVNLISKYNLNTAGTKQLNATATETACAFSSTIYWASSFTSSPFNLNDLAGYTDTDAIGKTKKYGISKGAISSRLLSLSEAAGLEIKQKTDDKIKIMFRGLDSVDGYINYWLGSAYDESGRVWRTSTGTQISSWYRNVVYGVRPVITVLKSTIT